MRLHWFGQAGSWCNISGRFYTQSFYYLWALSKTPDHLKYSNKFVYITIFRKGKNIVFKFSSRGRLGNEFPIEVLH